MRSLLGITCLCCVAVSGVLLGCRDRSDSTQAQQRLSGAELATALSLKPDGGKSAANTLTLQPVKMISGGTRGIITARLSPNGRQLALVNRSELALVSVPEGVPAAQTLKLGEPVDPMWSPDSTRLVYSTSKVDRSAPVPPGFQGYGSVSELHVLRVADFEVKSIGQGRFLRWSPDGQQIAWMPWPGRAQLVVSNARTGRVVSRRSSSWDFYSESRARPSETPDRRKPETWAGTGATNPMLSPDAQKVISIVSPRYGVEYYSLGRYEPSGIKEIAALPQMRDCRVKVAWYPDSRKFVYLLSPGPSRLRYAYPSMRAVTQRLYLVSDKGKAIPVRIDQQNSESEPYSDFQVLDGSQNLVVYHYSPGNAASDGVWIGQLQGVK